jgi:hypothetical protein
MIAIRMTESECFTSSAAGGPACSRIGVQFWRGHSLHWAKDEQRQAVRHFAFDRLEPLSTFRPCNGDC